MASKTYKQLTATAALTASLVMMGGTAFASTAGDASERARSTAADARNQIHRSNAASGLLPGPVGDASETVRGQVADIRNQIHRDNGDHTTGDASTFARNNVADVRNQVHRQQW